MGTRSLTYVYDDYNITTPIVCMYRQFDGYPSGHGAELAEFLNSFDAIVNGIRIGETRKVSNGMDCLAAQMIAFFKKDAGGFYLYPTILNQDCGQDYEYHVWNDKVKITCHGDVEFYGTWQELVTYCAEDAHA